MNRAVSSISKQLCKLQLSQATTSAASRLGCSHLPASSSQNELLKILDVDPASSKQPMELPACFRNAKIYTFPTANKEPLRAPGTFIKELLEMFDPSLNKVPMEAPSGSPVTPMYAGVRMLTIRRHKMHKHKRFKRYKRDRFIYMKRHRAEKMRSEKAFRKRMKDKLAELETFNPEDYIRDVIMRAKREWTTELAPSGRKLYPHWSTLMSLEELYSLPDSDYIDKRAGLPEEEDKERIRQLKIRYYKEFRGEDIAVKSAESSDDKEKE